MGSLGLCFPGRWGKDSGKVSKPTLGALTNRCCSRPGGPESTWGILGIGVEDTASELSPMEKQKNRGPYPPAPHLSLVENYSQGSYFQALLARTIFGTC